MPCSRGYDDVRASSYQHSSPRRRSCSALALAAPATVSAFAQPSAGEGTLPGLDTRSLEQPSNSEARAQGKLADSLGPLGFADAGGALGGLGFVGTTDGYLTGASSASPADVALGYVAEHKPAFGLDSGDIGDLELSDEYTSDYDGVTHLTFSRWSTAFPPSTPSCSPTSPTRAS